MTSTLSLGPLLFNWPADKARDFYFRMAEEAPVDTVYLGEVVCAKRLPFNQHYVPEVLERLQRAGKRVVLSTLALVMDKRDMDSVRAVVEMAGDIGVEANDLSAIALLEGRRFAVGPYVNVYNESTLRYFEEKGARHICLPVELSAESLRVLAAARKESTLEMQVFGRLPLAIASRCYHARAQGKHKDGCQYVCEEDADGLTVRTLDREQFLAVNGLQTLSYTYSHMLGELEALCAMGIHHFRLSPHDTDMVEVSRIYRALLDKKIDSGEAIRKMAVLLPDATFSNGFYYGNEGIRNIA
ncbi:MAG: U32 family peptidase [Alphaproteobacteria bacterium]|nr:U32 family peptidase [Alphaproteobacteria bacterium]